MTTVTDTSINQPVRVLSARTLRTSCAVVRWLKILNLAVTHLSTRTIAEALKKTSQVDYRSPHVCHTRPVLAATTTAVPLLRTALQPASPPAVRRRGLGPPPPRSSARRSTSVSTSMIARCSVL